MSDEQVKQDSGEQKEPKDHRFPDGPDKGVRDGGQPCGRHGEAHTDDRHEARQRGSPRDLDSGGFQESPDHGSPGEVESWNGLALHAAEDVLGTNLRTVCDSDRQIDHLAELGHVAATVG